MALLCFDGFEGLDRNSFASANGVAMRYAVGSGFAGSALLAHTSISPNAPTPGSVFSPQVGAANSSNIRRALPTHSAGALGIRVLPFPTGGSIAANTLLRVRDHAGGVDHLTLKFSAAGAVEVRRGTHTGTLLGSTADGLFSSAVWRFLELKYAIDDTDGGVWLTVDGADVLRLGVYAVSPTTLDTRNGGAASIDSVALYATSTGATTMASLDDLYVCDLTGASPYNDFLGDVRVLEMIPDAAGDSTQFTPSAGNNWQAVDEVPGHDSDTTYVESSTAGHKDLYSTADPASSAATIYAAKVVVVARKTDAGDQALELGVKSTSTESFGTPQNLADSYGEYTETFLADPATAAPWTTSGLNATQVGFRIPT